jgi:hypothetical protein
VVRGSRYSYKIAIPPVGVNPSRLTARFDEDDPDA